MHTMFWTANVFIIHIAEAQNISRPGLPATHNKRPYGISSTTFQSIIYSYLNQKLRCGGRVEDSNDIWSI